MHNWLKLTLMDSNLKDSTSPQGKHYYHMINQSTSESLADSADLYDACGSTDLTTQSGAYAILWDYLYRIAFHIAAQQPDQEALAQDCAQQALIRIHQQRQRCKEPKAFRTWSRRIVSNLAIDELRRRRRLQPSSAPEQESLPDESAVANPEIETLESLTAVSLRRLLHQAPISDRSRRVVIGRYLDDLDDATLAQTESQLISTSILPSHVQVTRSKNISKLRQWPLLRQFLQETAS